ncbi:YolD-like family protein [Virgibacillus xinjiangensis]|uniref:YolD-like family protein n=1 Tax=Virgibacillus xinjiangensis TaxID=393090 RepID=A0ABV7CW55_9BACI
MGQLNDRGTKKWTSLMMPEHIQLLNKMWEEKEYKEKPILDEQKMQDINAQLQLAIHSNLTVNIKYYANHDYETIAGKLLKIDSLNKQIQLNDEDRTVIPLDSIMDIFID